MLLVSLFVCEFGVGIACYFPYSRFKIVAYLICHNLAVSEVVVNLQYSHTNDWQQTDGIANQMAAFGAQKAKY